MYKVDLLLNALDSFIESAHDRLTETEMQLLRDIRASIAENQNEQAVEEQFIFLFNFLMLIKEYVDRIT